MKEKRYFYDLFFGFDTKTHWFHFLITIIPCICITTISSVIIYCSVMETNGYQFGLILVSIVGGLIIGLNVSLLTWIVCLICSFVSLVNKNRDLS